MDLRCIFPILALDDEEKEKRRDGEKERGREESAMGFDLPAANSCDSHSFPSLLVLCSFSSFAGGRALKDPFAPLPSKGPDVGVGDCHKLKSKKGEDEKEDKHDGREEEEQATRR